MLWDFLTSDFPPHKRFHMPLRHNKQQIYYVAQYSSMKLSIEHCVSLCLTCSISNPFDGSSTCITDRLKNDRRKLGMITLLECYRDLFWTRGLKTPKNGQTSAFPIHFPSISHPFPTQFDGESCIAGHLRTPCLSSSTPKRCGERPGVYQVIWSGYGLVELVELVDVISQHFYGSNHEVLDL